ncbi:protein containing Signal transduction response regulator, receiver region domain protein, partial [gut metagenome]
MKKAKILVVDDNSGIRAAMQLVLGKAFDSVELAATPTVIPHFLREFRPDVILLNMNFQTSINTGNEGLFWLSEIKRLRPETEVVLFTAYADIALAVEGMKRGAFDFIVKPCDNHKIVTVL